MAEVAQQNDEDVLYTVENDFRTGDKNQLITDEGPQVPRVKLSPTSNGEGLRGEMLPLSAAAQAMGDAGRSVSCMKKAKGLTVIISASVTFAVAVTVALIIQIYLGPPQVPPHGAVTSDVPECSQVGVDILKKGGSAVDSAIATLLCVGVVNPQSSGIGGGGAMVIHSHRTMKTDVIDFQVTAPLNVHSNMFDDNEALAKTGIQSIAVPGELRGLAKAYSLYGSLKWKDLVQPSINIARNGFKVTKGLADALEEYQTNDDTQNNKFSAVFFPNGKALKENDTMKREDLAVTLTYIANEGAESLYRQSVADDIIKQMAQEEGGIKAIITKDDLSNYEVKSTGELMAAYGGYRFLTTRAPTSGPALMYILKILEKFNFQAKDFNTTETYHRLIEAFKFAYAARCHLADPSDDTYSTMVKNLTEMMISDTYANTTRWRIGDESIFSDASAYSMSDGKIYTFANLQGGAHVSVIGPSESMVSVTSTLGGLFGSRIMTEGGVLLNNGMAAFSLPTDDVPNQANYIDSGKRALSGIAPGIMYSHDAPCSLRATFGGGSGTKIITGVAQVLLDLIEFKQGAADAVNLPRVHEQLFPTGVLYEETFPSAIVQELEQMGHNMTESDKQDGYKFNTVQVVSKINETLFSYSDGRDGGAAAQF